MENKDMLRVVIVDDEPPALELMQRLFNKVEQCQVVGAFSLPSEALDQIPKLKPDAVFLDIEMPGMNGIELAGILIDQDEDLQVVFSTGYNQYALEAFRVNALDYIMKPVTAGALNKTVARLIKLKELKPEKKNRENKKQIRCFGDFEVYSEGLKPVKWLTRKVEELFAYFIIHRDAKIDKWAVGEALWPDEDAQKVTSNLHTTLYRLRKTLQEKGIPVEIESERNGRGGYRFCLGDICCDIAQFEEFIMERHVVDEKNIEEFERICSLYRGDLFACLDYTWCDGERERLMKYYADVTRNMAKHYIKAENYLKAAETLQQTLKRTPYDEEAHQILLYAYSGQKDRSSLVQHYTAMEALFKQELGVEPLPATRRIYEKLKKGLENL